MEDSSPPLHASNAAAIASALWDSADFEGAAHHYQRALETYPTDLEALHGLGRLKLAQNDLAAASLLLEQAHALALSLAGGGRDELAQRVRRDLAWCYYRLDRLDLAAAQLAALPEQAGLAAQLRAFRGRVPYRPETVAEEVRLPFLGTDPLPIVTVRIGGREHAFVVDTGTAQMVIDTGLMRELRLENLGTDEARFASGQRAPIGHAILPTIDLGGALLHDVPVEVMDVRRFAPQISGFLGVSLLSRFHVLFDFDEQLFQLRPRRQPTLARFADMAAVPFLLFDSHLILASARLNEHATMAYVTTALAGGSFTVPESSVRQAELAVEEAPMEGVSAGGSAALQRVRAAQLCLGSWCREGMEGFAAFFPAELEWRYGFRVGALVSHEFLRGSALGIDFEAMCLYLG